MSKYTEQFKLSAVRQYLTGLAGFKAVAKQFGIDSSSLRTWVGWYQHHGAEGLEKKYSHFSAQFKFEVLQFIVGNDLSHRQVAAIYNIRNPSMLADWERSYHEGGLDALVPRPRGRGKQMSDPPPKKPPAVPDDPSPSREALLAEVSYLRMENAYLKKLKALVQEQQKFALRKKRR